MWEWSQHTSSLELGLLQNLCDPAETHQESRVDQELRLISKCGFWNKREIWRVNFTQAWISEAASDAHLWGQHAGVVTFLHPGAERGQDEAGLHPGPEDHIGEVFKLGLAKASHHAWVLICQGPQGSSSTWTPEAHLLTSSSTDHTRRPHEEEHQEGLGWGWSWQWQGGGLSLHPYAPGLVDCLIFQSDNKTGSTL